VAGDEEIVTHDPITQDVRSQIMKPAKLFTTLLGLVLVGFGMSCLVWPEQLLGPAGIEMTSATAVSELRSSYGGLQIGFGFALFGR